MNIPYYGDGQYELQEDDRLRSNISLAKTEQRSIRSPSPLIPEDDEYVLDGPKYQAHRNSLNLQHPQPRPGPTGRHQSHLESQAQIFDPLQSSVLSSVQSSVHSPDYDQWGSNPSLARNRLSGGGVSQAAGNLSPISSDGAYSQHSAAEQAAAPPRPPKIRDDGPLIPQQPLAGHGQTRQMYSAQNEYGSNSQGALTPLAPIQEVRYSLETDTGYHVGLFNLISILSQLTLYSTRPPHPLDQAANILTLPALCQARSAKSQVQGQWVAEAQALNRN